RQFKEMTSFQRAARVATKKPATTARTAIVSQRERLLALGGAEWASTAAHPSGPRCLPASTFSITVMALRHTLFYSLRGGIRPDGSQGRPCVGHFRQGGRRAVAWPARGPRPSRIRRPSGYPRGAPRGNRVAP